MNRLLGILLVCSLLAPTGRVNADQPNVIFILLDDMGWGDFGVLHQNSIEGHKRHATPFLDRMAEEGMQLRAHYCPAPVCAPSRASLLTGVHQGHAEVRDNQFDKALANNHTLATVMNAAGYETWLVGKYGLQGNNNRAKDAQTIDGWPAYPTRRGFDRFYGYVRHRDGHVHYPADEWPAGDSDSHREPKEVWHNDREVSSGLAGCYTTDLFTARSKDWIIKHANSEDSDKPFFLYLALDTPHAALQVPATPFPKGSGVKGGLQWIGESGNMINTVGKTIDSFRHPDYLNQGWSDVEERFATMVRRIDQAVGDLLQTLRDLKLDENTLIVISCDNGPHHESYLRDQATNQRIGYTPESFQSYGPFDGTKRDVWEGGIRVGTLAWWPGTIAANSKTDSPSQFHDWMPTFATAAGIAPPARTDGVSLLPTLTGRGKQKTGQVYVEYFQSGRTPDYADFEKRKRQTRRRQMQVVFLDGYKGVRQDIQSHDDDFAIYDVTSDPKELNDLAMSSEKFSKLQKRMKDRVIRLRRVNASAKRPYDDVPIPSRDVDLDSEWRFAVFEGEFPYVPDTADLVPVKRGKTDVMSLAGKLNGAVRFRGAFDAPKTATYNVQLKTISPCFVRIHHAALFDADFGFDKDSEYETQIKLEAGKHPLEITV
ncbi:MAG: arylsulfatase, partial [Planctomycetota bacterium]